MQFSCSLDSGSREAVSLASQQQLVGSQQTMIVRFLCKCKHAEIVSTNKKGLKNVFALDNFYHKK